MNTHLYSNTSITISDDGYVYGYIIITSKSIGEYNIVRLFLNGKMFCAAGTRGYEINSPIPIIKAKKNDVISFSSEAGTVAANWGYFPQLWFSKD